MKVDVTTLIIDATIVAVYQNLSKFDVVVFKKLIIANNIIVYEETSIIQIQIINVAEVYFNF